MISSAARKPGDPVIYRMTKHSRRPGPRARDVVPTPNGDDYCYLVDKFWVVDAVQPDGMLLLRTRRGKTRLVAPQDLNLRSPKWWELLLYRQSFPVYPAPALAPSEERVAAAR